MSSAAGNGGAGWGRGLGGGVRVPASSSSLTCRYQLGAFSEAPEPQLVENGANNSPHLRGCPQEFNADPFTQLGPGALPQLLLQP